MSNLQLNGNAHKFMLNGVEYVNNFGGGGSATLIEKSVTANGTYNASDDNADGYSKVTVNVQGSNVSYAFQEVSNYELSAKVTALSSQSYPNITLHYEQTT